MKSNEEFIAGIYEKAAVYTEEKETKKSDWVAKATRIAAMMAVCVGLAGVGALVFGKGNSQSPDNMPEVQNGDYGIALTSESGDDFSGTAQLRVGPATETVTFTGVVEAIDEKENRIWLRLVFDETAPASTTGSMVCIKWDVLEQMGDRIFAGTSLTATGALSMYENEASEYNGCAELVLTDLANLIIR